MVHIMLSLLTWQALRATPFLSTQSPFYSTPFYSTPFYSTPSIQAAGLSHKHDVLIHKGKATTEDSLNFHREIQKVSSASTAVTLPSLN